MCIYYINIYDKAITVKTDQLKTDFANEFTKHVSALCCIPKLYMYRYLNCIYTVYGSPSKNVISDTYNNVHALREKMCYDSDLQHPGEAVESPIILDHTWLVFDFFFRSLPFRHTSPH